MDYWAAILLGVIQGVTEFLPVSSSGHLEIAYRLGVGAVPEEHETALTVLLHAATLLAILIAFWKELWAACFVKAPWIVSLAWAIVPTGLAGLFLKSWVDGFGDNLWFIAIAYCYTAALLYFSERKSLSLLEQQGIEPDAASDMIVDYSTVTPKHGMIVGFFQVFALLPGVSRSGSTLAGGLLAGMNSATALAYAFVVGVPLIGAAAAKDALDGGFSAMISAIGFGPVCIAFFSSLVSGVAAIVLLKILVRKKGLKYFSCYCLLLAIVCIVLFYKGEG